MSWRKEWKLRREKIDNERQRERECLRKVAYYSEEAADHKAESLIRQLGNERYQSYRCRFCGNWHVGRRYFVDKDELRT